MDATTRSLQWIESAGGPLVCMEEPLLDRRGGNKSSDYERACTAAAYLERIEIGSRYGLVLGDMPLSACIEKDKAGVLCIVRAISWIVMTMFTPLCMARAQVKALNLTMEFRTRSRGELYTCLTLHRP